MEKIELLEARMGTVATLLQDMQSNMTAVNCLVSAITSVMCETPAFRAALLEKENQWMALFLASTNEEHVIDRLRENIKALTPRSIHELL